MTFDQSLACSIDGGSAQARLAFFIDSDYDAARRSMGCRTCGRKEFHTQGPFLAKAVKFTCTEASGTPKTNV
jgi:peptide subunit release factor 1 (eRF1)